MKKYIFALLALLASLGTKADNIVVNDVHTATGQDTQLPIILENTGQYVSFQMDLTLPEGVTLYNAYTWGTRVTDCDVTLGKLSDSTYRLTATSFSLTPLAAGNDALVTLNFTCNEGFTSGTATVSNIRFVTAESERIVLDDVSFTIDATMLPVTRYYLQNVATGKWWGSGNDWGVQASLVEHPEFVELQNLPDGTYRMKSQVNNSVTSYYLYKTNDGGYYMDGNTPTPLHINQQADGTYTISDGSIYFGYNNVNTVMGWTSIDPTEEAVRWRIYTEEEMMAELSSATLTAPQDATFLIQDANFGRNNMYYGSWNWTFPGEVNRDNAGDNTNFCVESYHVPFTFQHTMSGVPNGVYALTAQGFYRQDGTDNEHLPVFFANSETRTFPEKAGTENSMTDASHSFSAGLYRTEPLVVEVTDGTLNIGTRLEENTQLWCIWDNFSLTYYGNAATKEEVQLDIDYQRALATLESGKEYLISTVKDGVTYYLKDDGYLTDQLAEAKNFPFERTTGGSFMEYSWFINNFTNGGDTNNNISGASLNRIGTSAYHRPDFEGQVLYLNTDGLYAVRSTNSNSTQWAASAFWTTVNDNDSDGLPNATYTMTEKPYIWYISEPSEEWYVELDKKELQEVIRRTREFATTVTGNDAAVADITAKLNAVDVEAMTTRTEIQTATQQVREDAAAFLNQLKLSADLNITTGFLSNATPTTNAKWWSVQDGEGNVGHVNTFDLTYNVAEFWSQSGYSLNQTTYLPKGKYRLTAQALTRTGMTATLSAGGASTNIIGVSSSFVNSRSGAGSYFDNGLGENSLEFTLDADGEVTIQLKADSDNGDHWLIWRNFTLTHIYEAPTFTPGDVDNNGIVSIADVTALVNIILGKDNTKPYQYNHDAADVDKNGIVSIADVTALVNKILGK
ncbi:MAG: hypothetical protein IJ762_09130 [Bacteroidaceae bacterium]|nr:hypothetical protein [Bacteroidaceae bacterium]